jgi:acetylornithine deacetylase/succinyl-diaminopimelate desuccinylase-like protein
MRTPRQLALSFVVVFLVCVMASPENRVQTPQQEVASLVASPQLHAIFDWFNSHGRDLADIQMEVSRIPAPPFAEARRADWLRNRFVQLGLDDVHIDAAGNVIGVRPGTHTDHYLVVSAHLDTVFPEDTPLDIRRQGTRLFGPGISDNGCGITAMLAVASAMQAAHVKTVSPILFVGNVGEEGEGDLRGMRYLFRESKYRDDIADTIVIDGGGSDTIITEALGSRRYVVTAYGPGGHSWSDFGTPNPIVLLARVIDTFSRTNVPNNPKTTFNIGTISGGTSVNSIPESASFKVDIRSTSTAEIERLEKALRAAITEVQSDFRNKEDKRPLLAVDMRPIGDRPAADLPPNARILQVFRAVDAQLGIQSRLQRASTDANIPLSLGREAVTIGGGGAGGGAHTLHEWYDVTNRDIGLKRISLTLLALAGTQ